MSGMRYLLLALFVLSSWRAPQIHAAEDATPAIKASATELVTLFNAGKAKELTALFAPEGELIDEEGVAYVGSEEISDVLTKFFERFPGAKLAMEIDSIRTIGDSLAIEEGTRHITTKEGDARAQLRYIAVRTKVNGRWLIASLREIHDDPAPTPHDHLKPLAWLVGDWVNEGSDAVVKISYRWSDDENYLLGDYSIEVKGKAAMKSTQRIGWNPVTLKIHSWLFDSDGGFSEGEWTEVEEGWMVKSRSVINDGRTGSATLSFVPQDKQRFLLRGLDRIVGDEKVEDFEVTVTKRIVSPGKSSSGATPSSKKE